MSKFKEAKSAKTHELDRLEVRVYTTFELVFTKGTNIALAIDDEKEAAELIQKLKEIGNVVYVETTKDE